MDGREGRERDEGACEWRWKEESAGGNGEETEGGREREKDESTWDWGIEVAKRVRGRIKRDVGGSGGCIDVY